MRETLQLILTKDQIEIIKAVLYFDVFNYPLTCDELFENSTVAISKQEFIAELNWLLNNKVLKQEGEFILSTERTISDIEKRLGGNAGADKIMPVAYQYSKKIASFPFVEAVCLSGGLSKNYYDEKSDIDFFIISKPDRLWICRTLLILRYKFLPKDKKKYWCTNYFISSDNMGLPDINAFTSTELAHLVPTINYKIYSAILNQNNWYQNWFPNKPVAQNLNCGDTPEPFLKSMVEKIFSGAFGKWVDDKLLYVTLKHWQKKYPELASEDFELQFRSRKNVCKRHTHGFQNKILKAWDEKQEAFEKKFTVTLR